MTSKKTIQLYGLKDKDQLVFISLLNLLSHRADEEWEVVEEGMADVAVVDSDNPSAKDMAQRFAGNGCQVVYLSKNSLQKPLAQLHLLSPIRAPELLACLNKISAGKNGAAVDAGGYISSSAELILNMDSVVKLRRWPNKSILKKYPYASRICAVLMNQSLALHWVAQKANVSADDVVSFAQECADSGVLQLSVESGSVNHDRNKRADGLFTRLRKKLADRG